MNARSCSGSSGEHRTRLPHDDTIGSQRVVLGRLLLPRNPVVRVIMPATAARPHRTELLLCGHHYRVLATGACRRQRHGHRTAGPAGIRQPRCCRFSAPRVPSADAVGRRR